MYKLLKANLFRLKKEIIFWMFIILTIGMAIFTIYRFSNQWSPVAIDKLLNEYINYIGLFIATFVTIFVGKEHSEGIIRNKIIVRTQ